MLPGSPVSAGQGRGSLGQGLSLPQAAPAAARLPSASPVQTRTVTKIMHTTRPRAERSRRGWEGGGCEPEGGRPAARASSGQGGRWAASTRRCLRRWRR